MAVKLTSEKVMVKDNTDRVKNAEALLTVQADLIAAKVANTTFNALAQTVYENEAALVIQANNIASKVSQTNYNGETIASLINQAANEVKILANKITLEGLITANGFFKVLGDGSIEAVNAKLSGAITATKMVATTSPNYFGEIGLTGGYVGLGLFDLRYGTEAFFEVLESDSGYGFLIRDKNNRSRVEATPGLTRLTSPSGAIRLTITDAYVNIIKNGNVIANWG